MRKIALADIPEEYYETQPLAFRGNISTAPVKKPTDISKIPQQIWIKKPGSSGKLPQDFEGVIVDLSIHSSVNLSVDLPHPKQGRSAERTGHDVDAKRERLIKLDQPLFHYRDDQEIDRLYNAAFNQPLINSEQSIRDLTLKIENRFQANGASVANRMGNRSQKTASISAYNPGLNAAEKWLQLQIHLLNNEQVILDLETDHSNELTKLDHVIAQVQQYGLKLDPNQVREKRKQIGLRLLQNTTNRLKEINNRHTIISANFQVEDRQQHYRLVLSYPLTQISKRESILITELPKQEMESGWANYYERLLGTKIQANVFGLIISSVQIGQGYWEIIIKPIVVYASTTIRGFKSKG
ncbi:MAG: hypothetical protein AAGF01_18625 [Cyanobacteria bacterium P01_G01_bin.38]